MKCSRVRKMLIPYSENLLAPELKQAVEGHLCSCIGCRSELEGLESVGRLIREHRDNLRPAEYPYSVADRVVGRAFGKESPQAGRFLRRPVVVGLAALAVAIFSYLLGSLNQPAFDNNDFQFYLESYNQASGVEIVAFGEPEDR